MDNNNGSSSSSSSSGGGADGGHSESHMQGQQGQQAQFRENEMNKQSPHIHSSGDSPGSPGSPGGSPNPNHRRPHHHHHHHNHHNQHNQHRQHHHSDYVKLPETIQPRGDGTVTRRKVSNAPTPPEAWKSVGEERAKTAAPKPGERATLHNFEHAGGVTLVKSTPQLLKDNMVDSYRYYRANPNVLGKEIVSGMTVSVMQVPESISFAFLANVPPVVGMYGTFFMAVLTGVFGGKPGMISGAAGALAVLQQDLTSENGVLSDLPLEERIEHLFMTMVLTGVIQIVLGFLRVGKFIRIVPQTVMLGFFNGLGILIFMGQLPSFTMCPDKPKFGDCSESEREWVSLSETSTWLLLLMVFSCMAVMHLWGRVPKIGKVLPASLVALVYGTLLEVLVYRLAFDIPTRNVGETASVAGKFPTLHVPDLGAEPKWGIILQFAAQLAMIGLLESMLTLQACNEVTASRPSGFRSNQENVAQGLGNLFSGLFAGLGGDAMIGQSLINIGNGARGRVSSTLAGVFILIILLVASPVIELIPIGALTSVLFMIVIHTIRWDSILALRDMTVADALVVVVTTTLAVVTDLAIAVAAGVGLSALVHSWKSGKLIRAETVTYIHKTTGEEVKKRYNIFGTIFFGTVRSFSDLFEPALDPSHVEVDFTHSLVADHSAVEALHGLVGRYAEEGAEIHLRNLSDRSHRRLKGHHKTLRNMGANIDDNGIVHHSPRAVAGKLWTTIRTVGGRISKREKEDGTTEPSDAEGAGEASSSQQANQEAKKTVGPRKSSGMASKSGHNSEVSPQQDVEYGNTDYLSIMGSFSLGQSATAGSAGSAGAAGAATDRQGPEQRNGEGQKQGAFHDIEAGDSSHSHRHHSPRHSPRRSPNQRSGYSPGKQKHGESSPSLSGTRPGEFDGRALLSKLRVFALPPNSDSDVDLVAREVEELSQSSGGKGDSRSGSSGNEDDGSVITELSAEEHEQDEAGEGEQEEVGEEVEDEDDEEEEEQEEEKAGA